MTDEMTPAEQRVLDVAKRLTYHGEFIYDKPRGDDTPIPTCAGCGASDWHPGRIKHYKDCTVNELIAAVRALSRGSQ